MDVIVIPNYKRPEYLHINLEYLLKNDLEDILTLSVLDRGFDWIF